MRNEETITNKIVPIETIIEVANYCEDQNEKYNNLFENDNKLNQNLKFSERQYNYHGKDYPVEYKIKFKDGKEIRDRGYNWFIGMLEDLSKIKYISIYSRIFYSTTCVDQIGQKYNDYKALDITVLFFEDTLSIWVHGDNMEDQIYKVHSDLRQIIEKNEDRYNNTVKNKNIRIQSFNFSIGIILSYIILLCLLINKSKLPNSILNYMNNKFIFAFGQWLIAGILGNFIGTPIMSNLYKNIAPKRKYSHYSKQYKESVYVDDISDYTSHDEVQIGIYAKNGEKRKIIEKSFKITSKIILVQIIISTLLLIFMK